MAGIALRLDREPATIKCYQKNVQELTGLVIHHSPRLRRIALAHLGNLADAEDALQDAVLAALANVGQFRGQAKMSTWLTAIVINSARMKLRRRLRHVQIIPEETDTEQNRLFEDLVVDTRPGPEEMYRNQELSEMLAEAVSRLSPALLKTFELRDIHGLNIRETAAILRVPSSTVKTRTARARTKLKEIMERAFRPLPPSTASSVRRFS